MGRLDRALEHAAAMPQWFVYAICDWSGRPVYVGRSTQPTERYRQHRYRLNYINPQLRDWIVANWYDHTFEVLVGYAAKQHAADAEREYIATFLPIFNKQHKYM